MTDYLSKIMTKSAWFWYGVVVGCAPYLWFKYGLAGLSSLTFCTIIVCASLIARRKNKIKISAFVRNGEIDWKTFNEWCEKMRRDW
jgi:hypothetical protein